MKYFLIVIALLLSGCEEREIVKESDIGVQEVCIKGVTYYFGVYRLAVALKADGMPYTCELEN